MRHSPSPTYRTADEETVASHQPGDPFVFSTLAGLAAPGASARFRIYVVTATGNEKGSATVKVARPAA